MRRVQALAGAAVLPVLLATACSDRPNDLYTYYDEPSTTPVAESVAAGRPESPVPSNSAQTTTTLATTAKPTAQRKQDPSSAALTANDLAAEEVQPDGEPQTAVLTALPDCAAPLLPAASAAVRTTWRYASGSVLRQYVAVHAADAAPVVAALPAALDCGTFTAEGVRYQVDAAKTATLPAVDAQHSWCATNPRRSTCTLALAESDVLTIVTVEASTLPRAQAAIGRLAPAAAAKLTTD